MRSAESAIGVSGFLISWATRCATSFHASCRCARSSSVMSSITSTVPCFSVCQLQPRTGHRQMHRAPRACNSISVEAAPIRCPRRITPASIVHAFGRQQRFQLSARAAHIFRRPINTANARLACSTTPGPSSVTTPLGNRLHNRFELPAPLFDRLVRRRQLRRRALRQLTARLQIRSHVVERAHQLRHLSR